MSVYVENLPIAFHLAVIITANFAGWVELWKVFIVVTRSFCDQDIHILFHNKLVSMCKKTFLILTDVFVLRTHLCSTVYRINLPDNFVGLFGAIDPCCCCCCSGVLGWCEWP